MAQPPTANTAPAINYHGAGGSFTDVIGSDTYDGSETLSNDIFPDITSPGGLSFPSSQFITLAPREVSYTPNALGTTMHKYSTPNYEDLNGLADYFADWGFAYQIKEGAVHEFTVNVPYDTITDEDFYVSVYSSTLWELVPNVAVKSLLYSGLIQNPYGYAQQNNRVVLPVTIQGAIQNAIANNQPGFLIPTSSQSSSYSQYSAIANQTFQYLRMGIDGINSYTQAIKRTAVVDINNTQQAFTLIMDDIYIQSQASGSYNMIVSTQDMVKNYQVNTIITASMLPSYSKIYGIAGLDPITYSVYAGWMVQPIQVTQLAQNKAMLTQMFVWDEWASGLNYIFSPSGDFPTIFNASSSLA